MGEIGKEEYSRWRALVGLILAHGKPPHSLNCFHKHVVLYDVTMLLRLHSKPFYERLTKIILSEKNNDSGAGLSEGQGMLLK